MPRTMLMVLVWLLATAGTAPQVHSAAAQQVVDRIVARIEGDIITLSEIRELAEYQQLVDGKAQPDDILLSELIEQWALNEEATAAQFPAAATADVDREVARIAKLFPSPQAYEQRLAALDLTRDSVRRIVERQVFLAGYIDYKFRPSVQVNDEATEAYYREQFVPALAAKKQAVPPLDDVREQIRELLVQRGISERASSWFQETKARLNIEIVNAANSPSVSPRHE